MGEMSMSRAMKCCLVGNIIGLVLYVAACWSVLAAGPEGHIEANDGPAFISFGLTALPVLLACTLLNVVVFVRAMRHLFIGKGWSLLAVWLVAVSTWTYVHLYVRSHIGKSPAKFFVNDGVRIRP
jgi:hypothetical protein